MSTEIKQFNVIDAAIAQLTKDYNHLPECSTDEGFEQAKTDYKVIRRFEIDLEEKRNKLLESSRKKIKTITAEARGIDDRLKKISSPFKSAIDIRKEEIKEEEAKRIADLKAVIAGFQNFVSDAIGKTSVEMSEIIESVDNIDVDECFDEFQAEARETLNSVKAKLSEMLALKVHAEIDEKKAADQKAENDRILLEQQQAKDKLKQRNQDLIDEKMLGYDHLINDLDELLEMDTYDLSVLLKERKDVEIERVDNAEKRQSETTVNNSSANSVKKFGESVTSAVDIDDINKMSSEVNHPETKEDILNSAFGEWWLKESPIKHYGELDKSLAEVAFKAGVKWATLE